MAIKRTAKAMSVQEYDSLVSRGGALEYRVDCLLREMPDADTIVIIVEKWSDDDRSGS